MNVPTRCQQLADQVEALERQRDALHDELNDADPAARADLLTEVRVLNRQVAAVRDQLLSCLATEPSPTPGPGLVATFTGQATITTTHKSAAGPFTSNIQLGLLFDEARTSVQVTAFPTIVTEPFNTPYGKNVTTVTKTGGGLGAYKDGHAAIPVSLHFNHSIDLPFYEEDSDLTVSLTTDPPGSPLDAEGKVLLVGSGVFQKGFLGGSTGTLSISGTIAPVPSLPIPE